MNQPRLAEYGGRERKPRSRAALNHHSSYIYYVHQQHPVDESESSNCFHSLLNWMFKHDLNIFVCVRACARDDSYSVSPNPNDEHVIFNSFGRIQQKLMNTLDHSLFEILNKREEHVAVTASTHFWPLWSILILRYVDQKTLQKGHGVQRRTCI